MLKPLKRINFYRSGSAKKKQLMQISMLVFLLLICSGIILILVSGGRLSYQSRAANPAGGGPYTDVTWPNGGNYSSREWDFTPLSDSYAGYYWSYQQGFVNGDGWYTGMQTGEGGRKKIAIYSVWNALGASADGATAGAWCQTFGGEGVGYSCRLYHNWVVGRTYHFKVERVSSGWWAVSFTDTTTGTQYRLGKIQVPSSWGGLSGGWTIVWTELFTSEPYQTCPEAPHAKGMWANFISDGTVKPVSYNPHINDGECKPNTKITVSGNTTTQEQNILAASHGLTGTYYNNMDLTGTSVTRIDPFIKLDAWDNSQVPEGIDSDTFSVRWEGSLTVPTSGTYTFYTYTNDGGRLWINNQQIINNWVNGLSEKSGTITLTGGQSYPIKMEYYDNTDTQTAKLSWSGPGITKRSIPQVYLSPKDVPLPTALPTIIPTATPTTKPTAIPTIQPTASPTLKPTVSPTKTPSLTPTQSVTPTKTPTVDPTPTSTLTPTTTLIRLTALLHGLGNAGDNTTPDNHTLSNKHPVRQERPFTLAIISLNNQTVSTLTGNLNFSSTTGTYDATVNDTASLPEGSYTMKLTVPGFLVKRVTSVSLHKNTLNTIPTFTLTNGDVTGDNMLTILDYNRIIACYSFPGFPAPCVNGDATTVDLDDNGVIDDYDTNLFKHELSVHSGD